MEPFTLSVGKCHISAILFESFKENFKKVSIPEKDVFNDRLEIKMSASAAKHNRFLIDLETIIQIDGRLRDLFYQTLFNYVTMQYEVKGDYFNGIHKFMNFYDISDDDVKFETLVKEYYRERHPSMKYEKIPSRDQYVQGLLFAS